MTETPVRDDEPEVFPGEWIGPDTLDLRPPPPPPTFEEQLLEDSPPIPTKEIPLHLRDLLERVDFKERASKWRVVEDVIGLLRHIPGMDRPETYMEKLRREEERSGRTESSAVGFATFGEQRAVLYCMDWAYFAGSLNEVGGEKFKLAVDLAIRHNLPLVSVYSTSGVRQQENFAGLVNMPKMVSAINRYKRETTLPHVAGLIGMAMGGVPAGPIPQADVIAAYKGTEYGFAGRNVIEAYEGVAIPRNAQRAELHAVRRNIDVIVEDGSEFYAFVAGLLATTARRQPRAVQAGPADLEAEAIGEDEAVPAPADMKRLAFERPGNGFLPVRALSSALRARRSDAPLPAMPEVPEPTPDELLARYKMLATDPDRPDAEYILQHAFDDHVPLYNSYRVGDLLRYPATIAAIGRIAGSRYLVLANQPSYQRRSHDGSLRKIPSSPGPADFAYKLRMLEFGRRLGLPAIYLSDTLGANPTLAAEEADTMRWISDSMARPLDYPHPVMSFVIGALGSGGGMATTPYGDQVSMQPEAMAFVAEPRSATAILNRTPSPSEREISQVLSTMSATAADQLRLGLIDGIIPEYDDPRLTVQALREAIVAGHKRFRGYHRADLLHRRDRRIGQLQAMPISKT